MIVGFVLIANGLRLCQRAMAEWKPRRDTAGLDLA